MTADFDWRQEGPQTWDIEIETGAGPCALRFGGNRFFIGDRRSGGRGHDHGEYPKLYARMAELVRAARPRSIWRPWCMWRMR